MSGKNPIPNPQAYEGVAATNPPNLIRASRAPTTNDKKYPIGTLWVDKVAGNCYQLSQAPGVWNFFPSLTTVDVTSATQQMTASATVTTYIADNATAPVVFTLPTTAVQGSVINVNGNGAGGWQIAQNASQAIKQNGLTTTTGTSGSLSSTNRYNCVTLFAAVGGASTIWVVKDNSGSFTFV